MLRFKAESLKPLSCHWRTFVFGKSGSLGVTRSASSPAPIGSKKARAASEGAMTLTRVEFPAMAGAILLGAAGYVRSQQ
jgi:hypothetical protein